MPHFEEQMIAKKYRGGRGGCTSVMLLLWFRGAIEW